MGDLNIYGKKAEAELWKYIRCPWRGCSDRVDDNEIRRYQSRQRWWSMDDEDQPRLCEVSVELAMNDDKVSVIQEYRGGQHVISVLNSAAMLHMPIKTFETARGEQGYTVKHFTERYKYGEELWLAQLPA